MQTLTFQLLPGPLFGQPDTKKINLVLVLGRASDLAWPWETEDRIKSLNIELEAKLRPGHDPLKQDLVLTLACLI